MVLTLTKLSLCKNFTKCIQDEFEMSKVENLNFFLVLQIKYTRDGIFTNQSKYIEDLLQRFRMEQVKVVDNSWEHQLSLI